MPSIDLAPSSSSQPHVSKMAQSISVNAGSTISQESSVNAGSSISQESSINAGSSISQESSEKSGPRRFHLFGYPIAHSASPAFQNECFSNLGLGRTHQFDGWSTSRIDEAMLAEIRSERCGGAAVTMPLKTAILDHLDEVTPASRVTKACNTIVIEQDSESGKKKYVGTNTDVLGVKNSLLRALRAQHPEHTFTINQKFPPGQSSGLVIGGGATTRSAVYALSTLGLSPIFLINRDDDEVRAVKENFAETMPDLELVQIKSVQEVDRYLGTGSESGSESQRGQYPPLAMIVGAIPAITPVTPAERNVYTTVAHILTIPPSPTSSTSTSPDCLPLPKPRLFLDMAYKPRLTPMLRIASALGWQDIGGVQAMIEQGLAQQRMWLKGSTKEEIASGGALGEEVEKKARELVENMGDVVPVGVEIDRSNTISQ